MASLMNFLLVIILCVPDVTQGGSAWRKIPGQRGCSRDTTNCVELTKYHEHTVFRCGNGTEFKICLKAPSQENTTLSTTTMPETTTPVKSRLPTPTNSILSSRKKLDNRIELAEAKEEDPNPGSKLVRACADIVIVLDFSCSVPRKDRIKGIMLADKLSERLVRDTTDGVWFGVVPFSRKVIKEHVWRFPSANKKFKKVTLHGFMENYKIYQACSTRIRYALQYANENYFKEPNDRNDNEYKDLVVVIGDGRTAPKIERKLGRNYANTMRTEQGVQFAWVKTHTVLVNRKKHNGATLEKAVAEGDAEIADIVTDPSLIFSMEEERDRLNNEEVVEGLLQYIRDNFQCNI